MIIHQAEKIEPHSVGFQAFCQPFQKPFAVMVVGKDIFTAVAANCDMIDRPLKLPVNLSKSTKLGKH